MTIYKIAMWHNMGEKKLTTNLTSKLIYLVANMVSAIWATTSVGKGFVVKAAIHVC